MTTLEYLHRVVIPAAYQLLPARMTSDQATAMLLAIALQESAAQYRTQVGGPAHGFWQFERDGGVKGVLEHRATTATITALCESAFQYSPTPAACYDAITDNDIFAACFARLLLWTLSTRLPERGEFDFSWSTYLVSWRPGKPHPERWDGHYTTAWNMVKP